MPREVPSIEKQATYVSPDQTGDDATRTLLKSFLIFMLPVLMDCVLQSIASTIGNVYIGRLLGAEDLAAASTFYPLLLILVSCGVGLGSGASVLVGQLWGAGHPERARAMASAAVAVSIVLGGVVAITGQWAVWPMLRLFSVPANITDHAAQYCRVFLAGTPALILVVTVAITLRGAGDNIRPLVMMGLQIVVSLVVTPILLKTSLGLSGAAVAAILGWVLALLLAGIWLKQSGHELAPGLGMLRELMPQRQVLWSVIRLGFPAMVEVATQGLAEIVLVGRINGFGSEMTAAYGLFTQTLTYIEYPGMAVGITVSVMCSHAIGARNPQRARDILRIGFLVGLLMTGALAAIVMLIPETVSLLFTSNPHVIALASHAFRAVMGSAVLLSLGGVLGSAMRASGDSVAPMGIMLGCIAFVELPAGYMFAHYYGAWGVWFGYTASFSAVFLTSVAYWALRWRHRPLVPVQ